MKKLAKDVVVKMGEITDGYKLGYVRWELVYTALRADALA